MKNFIKIMCFSALSFAAVSCGNKNLKLSDGEWRLESMHYEERTFVLKDKNPYIFFADSSNMIYGYGGCNNFFGKYDIKNGNKISISTLGSTLALCPEIDTEDIFMMLLAKAKSYRIKGDELVLYDTLEQKLANFTLIRNE